MDVAVAVDFDPVFFFHGGRYGGEIEVSVGTLPDEHRSDVGQDRTTLLENNRRVEEDGNVKREKVEKENRRDICVVFLDDMETMEEFGREIILESPDDKNPQGSSSLVNNKRRVAFSDQSVFPIATVVPGPRLVRPVDARGTELGKTMDGSTSGADDEDIRNNGKLGVQGKLTKGRQIFVADDDTG